MVKFSALLIKAFLKSALNKKKSWYRFLSSFPKKQHIYQFQCMLFKPI